MKILFVSQYFYPETFRGNDLVFYLIEKGHDVTVLTGKPNYPSGFFFEGYKFWGIQNELINGAKVIRIPTIPRGDGGKIKLILNYLSFTFFSFQYARFRTDKNFDIIFVQQLSPVIMALPAIWALKRNSNAKSFIWVLDLWPESLTALLKNKNRFLVSMINKVVIYIYSKFNYILISSRLFEQTIQNKAPNKKIFYFPNWAESIFENEVTNLCKIRDLPNGFNIMFAGNIGEAQDFETILNAAELTLNNNINWIIIGNGSKFKWIKKQLELRNIKNIFLYGSYPIDFMPSFFKAANVMLLTLKNTPEFDLTVPAKFQAYLASGKIILGAINGEANSLINDNKIGLASYAGEHNKLAENAIRLSLMTVDERHRMEERSYALYNANFSKKILLNRLEFFFNESLCL
jgi:glycosyltransferase involved in cell wall biosynthesis